MFEFINVIFIVVPIFVFFMFIFVFSLIFSPKLRAKMMGNQVKATKYMLDENKENLTDIATTMGQIGVNSADNIIVNNKEKLTNVVNNTSDITKQGIENTVRAIRNGMKDEEKYCKYCGQLIDLDSIFCKSCGKEQ